MKIDSATGEFKIYRVITQFNPEGAILTILDENESAALKIEMTLDETSLFEHELAHALLILKLKGSRLTTTELQQYKRVVNAIGEKLLGESKGDNDD